VFVINIRKENANGFNNESKSKKASRFQEAFNIVFINTFIDSGYSSAVGPYIPGTLAPTARS